MSDDNKLNELDEIADRFEAAVLAAVRPGERVRFVMVLEHICKEEGTNLLTVRAWGGGAERPDAVAAALLLADGMHALKEDAAN
jgi:hypothetical protein